jgi:putative transposase
MIDRTNNLPVNRQCQLLKLPRSTAYYQPEPVSKSDLALMRCIEERILEHPYFDSRMLRDFLRRVDYPSVGRKRVKTLMKRMDIEAICRKPTPTITTSSTEPTLSCCAA